MRSTAFTSVVSVQPSVVMKPFRASTETAMPSANRSTSRPMSSGSSIAAVPTTMRDAPASANASAVSKSRMPPPAWIFTVKRLAI